MGIPGAAVPVLGATKPLRRIPAVRLRRNCGYGAEHYDSGQGAQKRFHDCRLLLLRNFALTTPQVVACSPKSYSRLARASGCRNRSFFTPRARQTDQLGSNRNYASWRLFDNQRRIVEAGLSGTRIFLAAAFTIGGLFFVGAANAHDALAEKGRNAIDGCQSAPNLHACRQECYTTFGGYSNGYRQCIWGD
jgi:hypothetical protein